MGEDERDQLWINGEGKVADYGTLLNAVNMIEHLCVYSFLVCLADCVTRTAADLSIDSPPDKVSL